MGRAAHAVPVRQSGLLYPGDIKQWCRHCSNSSHCGIQSQNFSHFNQTVLEVKTLKLRHKIYLAYFYCSIKMLSVEGMLSDESAE